MVRFTETLLIVDRQGKDTSRVFLGCSTHFNSAAVGLSRVSLSQSVQYCISCISREAFCSMLWITLSFSRLRCDVGLNPAPLPESSQPPINELH
jgi:hypothetical protein